MNTLKIVADSNVLVSAALAINSKNFDSPSAAIFFKITKRDVIAVASPQMLYELADKLLDPRFGLSPAFILDFIGLLAQAVDMVSIRGLDMGCRDETDNMFIETAYNGRVDALVTRDRDLQDAQTRYGLAKRQCQVLNVTDFLAHVRQMRTNEDDDPRLTPVFELPRFPGIGATNPTIRQPATIGRSTISVGASATVRATSTLSATASVTIAAAPPTTVCSKSGQPAQTERTPS